MSWSISVVGKPHKVVEAIANWHTRPGRSEQSIAEFASVREHLIGLVYENYMSHKYMSVYPQAQELLILLNANGGESVIDGRIEQSSCSVELRTIPAEVCL